MSEQTPNPDTPEAEATHRSEPIPLTKINLDELHQPTEEAPSVPPPAPTPTPEAPAASPEAPAPAEDTDVVTGLNDLFLQPEVPAAIEAVAPENPDAPEEPLDLPARLRNELKTQKQAHEDAVKELAAARKALADENEALRKEMVVNNPLLDENVQTANAAMEGEITRIAKSLGNPAAARKFVENAKVLSDQYGSLGDMYSEGYDERFNKFREHLAQEFGNTSDVLMAAMPRVEELRGAMDQAVANANNLSVDTVVNRQLQAHDEMSNLFSNSVKSTLSYNEELQKVDNFATQNVVAKMIEQIPHFKEISDKLLPNLKASLLPPKPITAEDAPSLSAAERQQKQTERMAQYNANSQEVMKLIPLAFHCLHTTPILARSLAEAHDKLKAVVKDSPTPTGNPFQQQSAPAPAPAPADGKIRPINHADLYAD